jgi:hypothetical protein
MLACQPSAAGSASASSGLAARQQLGQQLAAQGVELRAVAEEVGLAHGHLRDNCLPARPVAERVGVERGEPAVARDAQREA